MSAAELAQAIDPEARSQGKGWLARCVSHEDTHPSLRIDDGETGLLVVCRAGCDQRTVIAELKRRGLWSASERSDRPAETVYKIPLPGGGSVEHVRRDRPEGKTFYWRRDGRSGLGGLKVADLPLYFAGGRLADAGPVVITEGEKAADAAHGLGLAAAGTVTGASGRPSAAVLSILAGRDVLLWPDNDAVGHAHMLRIADDLRGVAASVRIISWPSAPEGGDAADFAARGLKRSDFDALLTAAGTPNERATAAPTAGETQRPHFEWALDFMKRVQAAPDPGMLVDGLIPGEGMFAFHARPRAMKSLSLLELALAMTTGTPAFGCFAVPRAVRVGYLTEEDAERVVQARVHWLLEGRDLADPGWLALLARPGWNLETDLGRATMLAALQPLDLDVLMIDPVRASMPGVDGGPRDAEAAVATARAVLRETSVRVLGFGAHDTKPARDGVDVRARAEKSSGGILYSIVDAPIGLSRVNDRETIAMPTGYKQGADPEPFIIRWESATPKGEAFRDWLRATAVPYADADAGAAAEVREKLTRLLGERGAVTTAEAEAALGSTRKGIAAHHLAALETAGTVECVTGRAALSSLAAELGRGRPWNATARVWVLPRVPPSSPGGTSQVSSPAPPHPVGVGGGGTPCSDRQTVRSAPPESGGAETEVFS